MVSRDFTTRSIILDMRERGRDRERERLERKLILEFVFVK